MATRDVGNFLAGVIEGFYGEPWAQTERFELFDWMADWGLNTYLYAPKDDLKHRALWREPYSPAEGEVLGQIIEACKQHGLRFIYALAPGLDIRYSDEEELEGLQERFNQVVHLGGEHFALLFDDIPDQMTAADRKQWGTFAAAQCHVANSMFHWTGRLCPQGRFLFCPTAYCGRMANSDLGGEGYLATLGRELLPEIDVFWTGPEIVSREITVAHLKEIQSVLRRKPLIWDNLQANDYDGRRFYCGPYSGRPLEIRDQVTGLLSNPNNEFPLNFVPLRTLARFVQCSGPWDPRAAYTAAMQEWLARFDTVRGRVDFEELLLLGDCYYLPHEEGPEAEALYQLARALVGGNPAEMPDEVTAFRKKAGRLREICAKMTELRHRRLFYALSRRIWELREEMDLLERYMAARSEARGTEARYRSDFHLPGTYRGGIVARLQRLLTQEDDGSILPVKS